MLALCAYFFAIRKCLIQRSCDSTRERERDELRFIEFEKGKYYHILILYFLFFSGSFNCDGWNIADLRRYQVQVMRILFHKGVEDVLGFQEILHYSTQNLSDNNWTPKTDCFPTRRVLHCHGDVSNLSPTFFNRFMNI